MRFDFARLREALSAVPTTFRPILFLIAPLLMIHGLLGRVPEFVFRPPPPPPPVTEIVKPVDAPSEAIAVSLIEQSAAFKEPRVLTCPRLIDMDSSETEKYPLFALLVEQRLVTTQEVITAGRRQYSVELTTPARAELFADATEDLFNISMIVARRKMGTIRKFEGPPHAGLQPPLRYATLGHFDWSWATTNRVGRLASSWEAGGTRRGIAYFLREPSGSWALRDVQMTETRASVE